MEAFAAAGAGAGAALTLPDRALAAGARADAGAGAGAGAGEARAEQAGEMGCAIDAGQPTTTGKKNHSHRRTVGCNEQSELHRLFGQAGWWQR